MNEQQRAAALMQQRMARSNGAIPMDASPTPQRRVTFDPRLGQTPSQSPQQLRPTPSSNRPTNRVTGSGPHMIPPSQDPASHYSNSVEKAEGSDPSNENMATTAYDGLHLLFRLIILALLIGTMFVIPDGYKPFWITILGVVILSYTAFQLYYEWDRKAFSDSSTEDEKTKYKSWAIGMLYVLNVSFTAVVTGILLIMIWRIYSMVQNRTAAAPETEEEKQEKGEQHSQHIEEQNRQLMHEKMEHLRRQKKKHRRRPFV